MLPQVRNPDKTGRAAEISPRKAKEWRMFTLQIVISRTQKIVKNVEIPKGG